MINWNEIPKEKWPAVRDNVCEIYLREPNRYNAANVINAFVRLDINEYDYDGRRFIVKADDNLDVFDLREEYN